jgi:protein-L-isoaspartate O-methyltransferase
LLATTSHTCQDVAVIPLLWIAPLSLYLLSFILCFDHPRWYQREAFCVLTVVVMLVVSCREQLLEWLDRWIEKWNMPPTQLSSVALEVVPPLAMMFLVCMLCHGEVARLKPHPRKLTEFYLFIAIGGALGGVVTAVICPLVFSTYLEYPIVVVLGYMLALSILFDALWHRLPPRWAPAAMLIVLLPAAGMVVVVRAQRSEQLDPAKVTVRNFYGVLRVEDVDELGTALYHGRIQHGFQYWDEADRRTATTYYDPPSGVGLAMNHMQPAANRRIAVVGLGTGTMASYGQPGDQLYFFEINPMVVEIARAHFTYLSDTPAQVQIQVGDGRLLLQRMQGADFDIIVLDAFSGDAIPAHLLTMEAFQVYLNCLDPQGIIAVHVSNRFLDLKPIVARLAHEYSMQAIWIERDIVESDADAASDWVLVTRDQAFVEDENIQRARREIDGDPAEFPLWTDHHHSLFEILISR